MKKEVDRFLLEELSLVMRKKGYIAEQDLNEICLRTKIPFSRIYSVASFYSLFDIEKKGKHIIRICSSTTCHVNGSKSILLILEKVLNIKVGKTTKDGRFTLEKTSCIGCCNEAPAMLFDNIPYTKLTEAKIKAIIRQLS